MTLAVISLVTLFCASAEPSVMATPHQNAQQEAPVSKPAAVDNTQNQDTAQKPATTTPADTQKATGSNQLSAKKPRRRKKTVSADCNHAGAPAAGSTAAGPTSSGSARSDAGTGGAAPPASAAETPANCPPEKVIVRQGGTSEPNIQLAGGPAGRQASQQRDSVTQKLVATEKNLEKIAGRELTAGQQDMVNQTRQFMEQAKAALAAQDFDRAGTLAWKAQLLSDELANPQK